jgi:hypothetical protein
MIDLEEAWELALAEATERARGAGRADIARYLDLRRRNDLLRRAATQWLNEVVTALAAEANRNGSSIQIEQNTEHRFKRGSATMVGPQLILRRGVRSLSIECGWPRTPPDGIVKGNALACANLKHWGRSRLNEELVLVTSAGGSPQWCVVSDDRRTLLTESDLQRHIALLLQS